jgi:predicted Zn-dependent peptidase
MDYYADLEQKFGALTADDVLAALQKYIDPERLSVVVAGDFKADEDKEDKAESAKEKPAGKDAAAGEKKEKPTAAKAGSPAKRPKAGK